MNSHNRLSTASVALTVAAVISLGALSGARASQRPAWLDQPEYADGGLVTVVVFLDNEALTNDVQAASVPLLTRDSRIKAVTSRLKSHRAAADGAVAEFLFRHTAGKIERFWIVPAYKATLKAEDIETLAAMPGVSSIVPDLPVDMIEPVDVKTAVDASASSSAHISLLHVQELWARGITGAGRLVCSFDTGVEESHPALSGNWRGVHASLASSWFSTLTPTSLPSDKVGHGSHTMGTMVGVEGTDTIGVAPGAEWIAAGVVDQGKSLSATFADILAAFQWALDPDGNPSTTEDVPDVILNSWGVPASLFSPCDQTFFAAIDNVEAAGIVCIFSAGNEGPSPSSLRNPASRATSPLNAFSVGAVDNSKVIAGFSSRGPGGCGFTEIKPEIVAPGVNVRSVNKDGGYKLMSGTSMAAPFIAGLVALCRQFNPDATVDEIKWAIINSCEDLGEVGEDNTYGYGLPNASKVLDFLSTSERPNFLLSGYAISGDGIALPGESIDLRVTLARTTGDIESVNGTILAPSQIAVDADTVRFFFGELGTTAIGFETFGLSLDPSLIHGDSIVLDMKVTDPAGQVLDTVSILLPIGYAPRGTFGDFDDGTAMLTVSDFGQFGLSAGSIYNLGGIGFRTGTSANLLFEAGIVLGRSSLQVSSAVRGSDGGLTPSDFAPTAYLSEAVQSDGGAETRTARFADSYADVPIPVTVSQQVTDYSAAGQGGIFIVKYRLTNTSLATLTDLYFGFLSDFDLPGGSESITYDASLNLLRQTRATGPVVGVVGLSGLNRHRVLANGSSKTGFNQAELFQMISSGTSVELDGSGDLMSLLTGGSYRLSPGDSVEVALALLVGASSLEVNELAARALALYLDPTDVDDDGGLLPFGYELYQNYPNPFNPTTTIGFSLPVSSDVSLEVFNLLGQRVRELFSGRMEAGEHSLPWNGCTDHGQEVASGVYFYRLTVDGSGTTRKMVLLR